MQFIYLAILHLLDSLKLVRGQNLTFIEYTLSDGRRARGLAWFPLFTPHRHQQPYTWPLLASGLQAVMFGTWLQPEREPWYPFSKSVYSFQMTECSELLSHNYWGFIPRGFCSFLLVLWYRQGGNWCSSFIVEKVYPGGCQKQVNDVGLPILIPRETVL